MKFSKTKFVLVSIFGILSIGFGVIIVQVGTQLGTETLAHIINGYFNRQIINTNPDICAGFKINPLYNIFETFLGMYGLFTFLYLLFFWKDIKSSKNKLKDLKDGFLFISVFSIGFSITLGGTSAIVCLFNISNGWKGDLTVGISVLVLCTLGIMAEEDMYKEIAIFLAILFGIFIGGHFWC